MWDFHGLWILLGFRRIFSPLKSNPVQTFDLVNVEHAQRRKNELKAHFARHERHIDDIRMVFCGVTANRRSEVD